MKRSVCTSFRAAANMIAGADGARTLGRYDRAGMSLHCGAGQAPPAASAGLGPGRPSSGSAALSCAVLPAAPAWAGPPWPEAGPPVRALSFPGGQAPFVSACPSAAAATSWRAAVLSGLGLKPGPDPPAGAASPAAPDSAPAARSASPNPSPWPWSRSSRPSSSATAAALGRAAGSSAQQAESRVLNVSGASRACVGRKPSAATAAASSCLGTAPSIMPVTRVCTGLLRLGLHSASGPSAIPADASFCLEAAPRYPITRKVESNE